MYVIIDSFDGLDERLTRSMLDMMVSYLSTRDFMEIINVNLDKSNRVISLAEPTAK